jgi:hypothetical protein
MRKSLNSLFFTVVLITLPALLLLVAAELLLRAAGFGYATTPLIQKYIEGEPVWVGNPDFTRLFESTWRGIPVLLSTVHVNLLDQPPVHSASQDSREDLQAEIRHFLEFGQAHTYLRLAHDLDQLHFRADSRINEIIRDQWNRNPANWIPVDAEQPLIEDHPRRVLGFPHFYEHVHAEAALRRIESFFARNPEMAEFRKQLASLND